MMKEICRTAGKRSRNEKGGVLFGTRQETGIKIVSWRPFDFSAADRRELPRLFLAARSDGELSDLQPLGWFVSRPEGDLALHDADVGLSDDFFSEPWQVTLVFAPSGGAIRARFFVRDAEGRLRADTGARDLVFEPLTRPMFDRDLAVVWRCLPWAIAALLAIILAGVLVARRPAAPPVVAGFALHMEDADPAFEIAWDANSPTIRDASRAEISVRDGNQASEITLDATQLRLGKVRRQRGTNDVEVRMKVGQAEESARLVIKTVSVPAVAAPSPDPLEGEVKRLNQELHQERVISDKLKQTVKILENTIAVDKARKPQ